MEPQTQKEKKADRWGLTRKALSRALQRNDSNTTNTSDTEGEHGGGEKDAGLQFMKRFLGKPFAKKGGGTRTGASFLSMQREKMKRARSSAAASRGRSQSKKKKKSKNQKIGSGPHHRPNHHRLRSMRKDGNRSDQDRIAAIRFALFEYLEKKRNFAMIKKRTRS